MRKVLMIVYAWPPSGGPGVQRCLKFVKYLPKFGWESTVLTVEKPETPADDASLSQDVPTSVKVYRTRALEPFTAYKILTGRKTREKLATGHIKDPGSKGMVERISSWIRLNLFIPDAKIGWLPYGVSAGHRILEGGSFDLIFSSGPPHTTHLIARKLAKSTGLPWVADFRDPWVDIDYYHFAQRSRLSTWIDHRLETTCLRRASATTTVCSGLVTLLSGKPNAPASHLLPNGFDHSDIPGRQRQAVPGALKIYYGGSLSPDRVPHALIQALAAIKAQDSGLGYELQLAGNGCDELKVLLQKNNLSDAFHHMGYLPHAKAARQLVNADISLLTINRVPGNKHIVTGKIFEYMGAGNPILGIGPTDGDAARLLEETGSGKMFDYEDSEGVKSFLTEASENYGRFKASFTFDCAMYSRELITKKLAAIFDGVSQ